MPDLLRKYRISVYKPFSGVDLRLVTAVATIKAYQRGTTYVSGGPVSGANVTLTVRDSGNIAVGDVLQKGTDTSVTVTVDQVISATSIRVDLTTGASMVLAAEDRLVKTNARPTLYKESSGVSSYGASDVTTDATTGEATFYSTEPLLDIIVTGSGLTDSLHVDEEAGYITI